MTHIYLKVLVILGIIAFSSCKPKKNIDNMNENLAINEADMNLAISPGENFYQFSIGGWIKNNPVTSHKTQ